MSTSVDTFESEIMSHMVPLAITKWHYVPQSANPLASKRRVETRAWWDLV